MNKRHVSLLPVLLLSFSSLSAAEELPLYELGIGAGSYHSPHYLGADQDFSLLLPVPYFVYRGKYVRTDRSGIKTILFDNNRFDLSISLGGGLPVDSEDNRDREGMPDLDLLLEAGPVVRYTPYRNEHGSRSLSLELPLRATFSVDNFSLHHQGWISSPALVYRQKWRGWKLTTSLGAEFSDRSNHGYFYDVDTPYVTAERSFFKAGAGYTASRLSFGVSRSFKNWYLGGFVRYYDLSGAENEDSPLVKEDVNFSAGIMLARKFYRSKKRAAAQTEE